MIKVENLSKIFRNGTQKEVFAVNDVSFTVSDGEILGLLGPNGAGKTTMLRMLSTILKPTSGTAIVNGFSVTSKQDEVRNSIGFLTGGTKLYDMLTARETFYYFGRLYNLSELELQNRIENIVQILGIDKYLDKRVSRLSDGMRQKVSIGRTIIHNPMTLILDEPLIGLDILARRAVTHLIQSSKKQGKSVILATHIMSEAEEMCDRIAVMYDGKILDIGMTAELKEKYDMDNLEDVFIELVRRNDEEICSYT